MKVIRFRQAIFKDDKFHHWHYWGFCGYRKAFVAPITSNLSQSGYNIKPSEQYIGHDDKNDVGIYDGDTVQDFGFTGGKKKRIGKVVWDERNAEFFIESIRDIPHEWCDEMGNWWTWSDLEIIGNMYETPKLLEVEE